MLGWLLNFIYLIILISISPVLILKRVRHGKYRDGWLEKLWGQLPESQLCDGPKIWLHAVSVGEVLQLQQVIRELREQCPAANLIVTTTTQTGYQVACDKLTDCQVAYFPLDFTWSVKRALRRVRPDLIVLVELELWPNFLTIAHDRHIPVALINGRLSERSFRGYRKLRRLFAGRLNQMRVIAVQSAEYRQRFLELGCRSELVDVTGSIKFDGVQTDRSRAAVNELRQFFQLQPNDVIFIAGSTQAPEEEMAIQSYTKVREHFPQARLIIVPRHPERGDAIARSIQAAGYSIIRRSSSTIVSTNMPAIGLLDTVGELSDCWALADIAFVGGSFGDRGGQNMLEPAAYGAAVCFGPNTRNFRQIVEQLNAARAAVTLSHQQDLDEFLLQTLIEPHQAQAMGQRARELVLGQQGATHRTVEKLMTVLEQTSALTESSEAA